MIVSVKVAFYGLLNKNKRLKNLELNVNDTIEKALEDISRSLNISLRDLSQYILLVNGRAVTSSERGKKLKNDDVLIFVPKISGG